MKNPNKPERQNTHLSLYYSSLLFPFLSLSSSSTACARSANGRATSGETNTAATDVTAAEHGRVAEHVWNDEEAHVRTPDVDLVEMGDAAVSGGDGDVLELDVHVVLSVKEFAAVGLTRGDFEGNNVALCLVQELDGNTDCGSHDCGCVDIEFVACTRPRLSWSLVYTENW
jgi:hypothetical protein